MNINACNILKRLVGNYSHVQRGIEQHNPFTPPRFIGSTGRGALRKVGDTARGIKSFAGKVNDMTGGAAGVAFNAAKAGAITSSYALANQFFSIDVVSISEGVYDAMVDQMLASGAPIEIPFKN